MAILDATPADLPGILEIYNHAVVHTTAIWNESSVDLANRQAWFEDRQQKGYPILVTHSDQGQVTGYASYGDWRAFQGYRHTVEHSVYVHPQHQGQGLGRQLMEALLRRATLQGKHVMVAAIEASNTASIQLHAKLGFEQTGLMPEVGTKFGRWLDLAFLQKRLNDLPPN